MNLSQPIYVLKRRAKALARQQNMPLSAAQNQLAMAEGFASWSLVAAEHAARDTAADLLAGMARGHLVLIGARPGQGKTLLALEILAETMKQGRDAALFTLEYTSAEVQALLAEVAPKSTPAKLRIDTSDGLNAAQIVRAVGRMAEGGVAVVDYLQLLDQRRDTPPLAVQLSDLRACSRARGVTLLCLSQIDRHFDARVKPLPDAQDVRLPNPVDLRLFDRMVFLHEGKLRAA